MADAPTANQLRHGERALRAALEATLAVLSLNLDGRHLRTAAETCITQIKHTLAENPAPKEAP